MSSVSGIGGLGVKTNNHIYEHLRRHLDRQAIGFPAARNGAALRVLKHIFTPDEARIAAGLSDRHEPLDILYGRLGHLVASPDELAQVLERILKKGGIEVKVENGRRLYANTPLLVGMYELQIGRLTPEFLSDFQEYTSSPHFGLEFLGTALPQMRTIPVERSLNPHHGVSSFDEVAALLAKAPGPFVVLECICRLKKRLEGQACRVTDRRETCLGFGSIAQTVLEGGNGRAIDRHEALTTLRANQKDGLVLQSSNTEVSAFICSCCGCCCGMLQLHRSLPRPVDFWSSNFLAAVDPSLCNGCGICQRRCQVGAVSVTPAKAPARVDATRCLGCGQCVEACPQHAILLHKKTRETVPPSTREDLHALLKANRRGPLGKAALAGKLALDMLRTGNISILRKES
jgi:ferredoxin